MSQPASRFCVRAAQAALIVLALAACWPPAVVAAISVSVAPPVIEKIARPGATIRDVIIYRNGGTDALAVSVSFADFAVEEDGSVSERPAGLDRSSVLPYARITPLRVRVEPGEQVLFRYTIRAPREFAQLRAMIMFAGVPQVSGSGNRVVFAPRVGVPIYIESTAARPPFLEVGEVRWERSAGSPEQVVLSMNVLNTGQRNIRPAGTVLVRSSDGRFQETFDFNKGREPVLPGQKRNWTLTFGPVPGGELSVNLRFATSFRDSFSREDRIPAAGP